MKIYIAGKIAGDPNYREKFRRKSQELERGGHIALNPATLPDGMEQADYMRICFAMLDCADMVLFLPDWEESQGAKLENAYCRKIQKDWIVEG